MKRRRLDYAAEEKVFRRKFDVLRTAAGGEPNMLAWLARKEAILLQCVERKLPKKVIACGHSELRGWVRDGLFPDAPKEVILKQLAAIDADATK
jgi:hypothetical protein